MDSKHIPAVEDALLLYMRANSLTQQDMAERLGVSQTAVSNVLLRGFGPLAAKKWAAAFGFNRDFLMTGRGDLMQSAETTRTNDMTQVSETGFSYNPVPLIPVLAQAGHLVDFSDAISEYDCERIISPVKGVELAVPIYGESMAPEFPNGSIVFVKRIDESAFIEWGKTYILDTVNGTVIKYLTPGHEDGFIKCVSANPAPIYAPFEVSTRDILGVYKVVMCMSMK